MPAEGDDWLGRLLRGAFEADFRVPSRAELDAGFDAVMELVAAARADPALGAELDELVRRAMRDMP